MSYVILIVEILLTAAIFLVALLVFMMVRQIGIISRRIPKREKGTVALELVAGDSVPRNEFPSHDGLTTHALPLTGGGRNYLIFASFSCPVCRPLMERLHRLPRSILDRTLLMLLDTNVIQRFAGDLRKMRLEGIVKMTEALHLSSAFKLQRAPFLYIIEDGKVVQGHLLFSFDDLVAAIQYEPEKEPVKEYAEASA